jgi:hypothetical protein
MRGLLLKKAAKLLENFIPQVLFSVEDERGDDQQEVVFTSHGNGVGDYGDISSPCRNTDGMDDNDRCGNI